MRRKEVGTLMERCMKEGCTYVDGEPEKLESEDERRLGLEACLQAKEIDFLSFKCDHQVSK